MSEAEVIESKKKDRRIRTSYFVLFTVGILLVMIFPVYGFGNRVEPYVFGLPFSMFWVIFWIVVEFFGVIAFFLYEHGGEGS